MNSVQDDDCIDSAYFRSILALLCSQCDYGTNKNILLKPTISTVLVFALGKPVEQ